MIATWLKFNIEPGTLPTTAGDALAGRSTAGTDVMNWIRSSLSSASDTLRLNSSDDTSTITKGASETQVELVATPGNEIRERNSVVASGPVSFPSFLNSGRPPKQRFDYRRASLLDGLEKTLDVSVSGRAVIALPLKETKRKLNKALKNLLRPQQPREELFVDEESGEQSLLPLPIHSLPKPLSWKQAVESNSTSTSANCSSRATTVASIVGLVAIFLACCTLIGLVYNSFPELSEDEKWKVKLPRDIDDAKALGKVLSKYKTTYHYEVMSAFFIAYIFLQTFAIPGSVFLSILSGFMYPFWIALFLVCLCSGIGATGCYAISHFVGKPLVQKFLEERVRKWNYVVDGQREHLFNYLLFLRITPFLPNWFINIVSPVIEIPVSTFFFATFLGVAPLSFIAIQAGTTLYQLTTAEHAISWTGIGIVTILAVLSLLPVLLKSKLKEKFK